jgi:hypothetical protein
MLLKINSFIVKHSFIIETLCAIMAVTGILLKAYSTSSFLYILIPGMCFLSLFYLLMAYNPYPQKPATGIDVFLYKLACLILFLLSLSIMVMLLERNGAYFLLFASLFAFLVFSLFYIFNLIRYKSNPKPLFKLLIRLLFGLLIALSLKQHYEHHMHRYQKLLPGNKQNEATV